MIEFQRQESVLLFRPLPSKLRRRYERQGILVENAALESAERECSLDADERATARARAAALRREQDRELIALVKRTEALFKSQSRTESLRLSSVATAEDRPCGFVQEADLVLFLTSSSEIDCKDIFINAVAEATWGMNGGLTWVAPTAFFRSGQGAKYFQRLDESLQAHIASL